MLMQIQQSSQRLKVFEELMEEIPYRFESFLRYKLKKTLQIIWGVFLLQSNYLWKNNRMDKKFIKKILMERANREGYPTQQEVANFLSRYYPEESKEDKLFGDNWGLYSQNPSGVVKRILLCTTPTQPIINLAKEQGYDLVISHHDFLFRNQGVPQIIYHSAMDESAKGHNQYFVKKMGLKNIKQYHKVLLEGDLYKPLTLDEFKQHLIQRGFEINGMVWEGPTADDKIQTVLYCSGGGGMLLHPNHIIDATKHPADVYVTGELYNDPASERNLPFKYIIELGHTSSEKPLFKWIKNMLRNRWQNLEIDLANNDIDVWGTDNYKNRMEKSAASEAEWEKQRQEYLKNFPAGQNSRGDDEEYYEPSWEFIADSPLIQDMLSDEEIPDADIDFIYDYIGKYYESNSGSSPIILEIIMDFLDEKYPDIGTKVKNNFDHYFPTFE